MTILYKIALKNPFVLLCTISIKLEQTIAKFQITPYNEATHTDTIHKIFIRNTPFYFDDAQRAQKDHRGMNCKKAHAIKEKEH